jgi:hypothetical protein
MRRNMAMSLILLALSLVDKGLEKPAARARIRKLLHALGFEADAPLAQLEGFDAVLPVELMSKLNLTEEQVTLLRYARELYRAKQEAGEL